MNELVELIKGLSYMIYTTMYYNKQMETVIFYPRKI